MIATRAGHSTDDPRLADLRRRLDAFLARAEADAAARGHKVLAARRVHAARLLGQGWRSLNAICGQVGCGPDTVKAVADAMKAAGALPADWALSHPGSRGISPEQHALVLDHLTRPAPLSDVKIADAAGVSPAYVAKLARDMGQPVHPHAAKRLESQRRNGTAGRAHPHGVRLAMAQAVARLMREHPGLRNREVARIVRAETGAAVGPSRIAKIKREIAAGRHDAALAANAPAVPATLAAAPERGEPRPVTTTAAASPPPGSPLTVEEAVARLDAEIAGLDRRIETLRAATAENVDARVAAAVEDYAAPRRARLEAEIEEYRRSVQARFGGEAMAQEGEMDQALVALREKRSLRDGLSALLGAVPAVAAKPEQGEDIASGTAARPVKDDAPPPAASRPGSSMVVEMVRLRDEGRSPAAPPNGTGQNGAAAPAVADRTPVKGQRVPQTDIDGAVAVLRRHMADGTPVDRGAISRRFGIAKSTISVMWRTLGNGHRMPTTRAGSGRPKGRGKNAVRALLTGDHFVLAAESAEALVKAGLSKSEAGRRVGKSSSWYGGFAEKRLAEIRAGGQGNGGAVT